VLPLTQAPAWLAASVLLVAAVIVASLVPGDTGPDVGNLDKLGHFLAYAALATWFGGLFANAAGTGAWRSAWRCSGSARGAAGTRGAQPHRRPERRRGQPRGHGRGARARVVAHGRLGAQDRGMAEGH
jgi:hypothetical protein